MIQAKKHLGQNFLRNPHILEQIVGPDDLSEIDVIEIGPGPGDLTNTILTKKPQSLTLIELDGDMIPLLKNRFGEGKFKVVYSDVLKVNISNKKETFNVKRLTLFVDTYRVYGNIPYYITSPIIHHFLYEVTNAPITMILTMQKEVADRILARDNKHTVLSLACHLVADMTKICDISPGNFEPVPKVWSTCLRFDIKSTIDREEAKKVLKLIELGFSQKRKKLISDLSNLFSLQELKKVFQKIGLDENIRAEDVRKEIWGILTRAIIDPRNKS